MNTTDFLSIANAICPDRDGIVFGEKRWTYLQINERVNQIGPCFGSIGGREGRSGRILDVNCNQYIESYYAVAKLGGIFVPLNFQGQGRRTGLYDRQRGGQDSFCGRQVFGCC